MPIDRERMKLYPGGSIRSPEWLAIRECIRTRANDACEGSPAFPDCRAQNGATHPETGSLVVCTVAHVNHDVTQNDDGNLRFWCQRCHLTFDAKYHAASARRTRNARVGQGDLLEGA